MQDHYLALGVGSSASQAEIKKAYRQLAARHHPDRSTAPDAATRFRAVQQAYDILGDEAARATYDSNRKRNLLDDPLAAARGIWADYFERLI
ncbi:DnaJ domain-containing protein [Xylophilus sp. Kf1]|nr:DnaJ domain-containing protein [Xylophilus sp. Kf1]